MLAAMSFVIFVLIGLMPGDPIDLMISANPDVTSEDAERLRKLHGLDQPLWQRYVNWASAALSGDFGYSRIHAKPVFDVISPALQSTAILLGLSFGLSVCIGIFSGVFAAYHQNRRLDHLINFAAFAGISIPPFWLAILLIILFSVILRILPAGGMGTVEASSLWESARYFVLPIVSLTIASVGSHTRYMRAAMIDVLRQDFIRTAQAKGLSPSRVVLGHALRNAMLPVITVVALDFGALFSGALITEMIFAYPGMGKLIFDSIMGNDFNLALIALLLATAMTLLGNLLADGAYVCLDPRIRLAGGSR